MFSRLALLAFAGILAFSPAAHVSMTDERGILFVQVRLNGMGPLLGPALPRHGAVRIDYANATLALISFDNVSPGASARKLSFCLER